jgi:hypothetical protein
MKNIKIVMLNDNSVSRLGKIQKAVKREKENQVRVSSNFRCFIIFSNILNFIQMKSKNFKITNNKITVNTVIRKKSIPKPNPTIVGNNTISPDSSKLFTNMLFLIIFTLKSRFS